MRPLPAPPPWLSSLQADFARVIQAPLDTDSGTMRARTSAYPATLLDQLGEPDTARARLQLYHEQYWQRLFVALQGELPRTAQVLGYWHFNQVCSAFLHTSPPTETDLARAADGFASVLLQRLEGLPDHCPVATCMPAGNNEDPWRSGLVKVQHPVGLLKQALRIDEAGRVAWRAPRAGIWRPSPSEIQALTRGRLRSAEGLRLLRDDWGLAERGVAPSGGLDTPIPPFIAHAAPRYLVSYRAESSTCLVQIDAGFFRLLTLAARHTFGRALVELESGCAEETLPALRAAVPGWITRALEAGWWVGVELG